MFMMFSATFPKEARAVAKEYMANDHIRIRVGRTGSTHINVAQNVSLQADLLITDVLINILGGLCGRAEEAGLPFRSSPFHAAVPYNRIREQQEGCRFP